MSYDIRFPHLYLDIDGVPMSCAAWEVTNLHMLLSGPSTRGSNIIVPGASGVRPKPKRATETSRSLEMYVWGECDPAGVEYPDPVAGLFANVELLRDLSAPKAEPSTATLHYPGGSYTAAVQLGSFEVGGNLGPTTLAVTIDMNLLAGAFA